MNRPTETFTSLGMHHLAFKIYSSGAAPASPTVLVAVEVSVPRLLHLIGRRLVKSKRGAATCASGSVRLRLARPEDQEHATEIWAVLKNEAAGSRLENGGKP